MSPHHFWMAIAFGILPTLVVLLGCGSGEDGSTAAELRRRQLQRQSADATQKQSFEDQLAYAQQQFRKSNYSESRTTLLSLSIEHPEDAEVTLLMAKCEAQLGNALAAAGLLEDLRSPQSELLDEADWLSAQWLADAGELSAAQQRLQRILERSGDTNRVHHRLASLLNNQGLRIQAASHLRALVRSGDTTEKELFAMNTYGDSFIDESIPKPNYGDRLVPAQLADARQLRSDGELDRARELIERLSLSFPQSAPIHAFQGRIYSDLHDDLSLQQWSQRTPAGIEEEPEYWHALGAWMQRQERHKESARCYIEAIRRDPTDRFSHLGLAQSLQQLGRIEQANCVTQRYLMLNEMANLIRNIGLRPGTPEELSRIAEILDQLNRPWESIAWQEVLLRTHGSGDIDEQRLQARRNELANTTAASVNAFESDLADSCGIAIDELPIPSLSPPDSVSSTTSPPDASSAMVPATPIRLEDISESIGLAFQYQSGNDWRANEHLLHQLTGGGIGVVDFDRDGWNDLYLTQGGGDAFDPDGSLPNQLIRNVSGQATDITVPADVGDQGYGQGVCVADINQDGFADLVVANIGPNVLYLNNGDGTFRQQAMPSVNTNGAWTTSIACGDLSGDHLPEVFEVNYVDDPKVLAVVCTPEIDLCNPSSFQPAVDHVWKSNQEGQLTTWKGCQNLDQKPNYGFAAIIADFDRSGGNDVFVANDTKENQFWQSEPVRDSGERTLHENAMVAGCGLGAMGQRQGCMGVAHGDFDQNGSLDLLVTNFWNQPADLYLQNSPAFFDNASTSFGLYNDTRMTVGWGAQAVDFDRDGWLDLAMLNGHLVDHRKRGQAFQMQPQLFQGDSRGFVRVNGSTIGPSYWSSPALGRTMAVSDWNRDHKPDLIANHLDKPVAVLENRTQSANFVRFDLVGTISERDAIGASIVVQCGDQVWSRWNVGGDGFLCSNESTVDFGLSDAPSIDQVEILWPSGRRQVFRNLSVNRQYLVTETDESVFECH
ncbi:FG-GAP-like repeat-containing protein [Stieleria varia]|uniref:ASPIC and UnbV n=1 Tax=Stieleria varia TaxID=2528005 RepID=A0A5C6AXT9_9BACT|nr:FG-GAP-like repeat-containing protein [Stieleria varia]TWU04281.1 ASPIC and UnbV [Stieleria varia]